MAYRLPIAPSLFPISFLPSAGKFVWKDSMACASTYLKRQIWIHASGRGCLMACIGELPCLQAAEASKVLQKELREADTDHDGLIDFQEFQHYFQRMALYQQNEARKQRLKRKTAPSGGSIFSNGADKCHTYALWCKHQDSVGLLYGAPWENILFNNCLLVRNIAWSYW